MLTVEEEFFFGRFLESGFNFFAIRSYVGVFVASMRRVTFAIQARLHGVQGLDE